MPAPVAFSTTSFAESETGWDRIQADLLIRVPGFFAPALLLFFVHGRTIRFSQQTIGGFTQQRMRPHLFSQSFGDYVNDRRTGPHHKSSSVARDRTS